MLRLTYPNSEHPRLGVGREVAAVEVSLAILCKWSGQVVATGWALGHNPVHEGEYIWQHGTAVLLPAPRQGQRSWGCPRCCSETGSGLTAEENKHFMDLFLCFFFLTLFPVGCCIAFHYLMKGKC